MVCSKLGVPGGTATTKSDASGPCHKGAHPVARLQPLRVDHHFKWILSRARDGVVAHQDLRLGWFARTRQLA